MNIPPILPVAALFPSASASGDGGAVMDKAGLAFSDVVSQSQTPPSVDDQAEWQLGSDPFMPPPPVPPFADPVPPTVVPSDEQQQMTAAADTQILPIVDGSDVENVSNIAENSISDAISATAPAAEIPGLTEMPIATDAGRADSVDQDSGQPPSRADHSEPEVELPSSDHPPDPSTESGKAQASKPDDDKNQQDSTPPSEDLSLQEFGLETVSDMAEIEQLALMSAGDPVPDAPQSHSAPSSSSSAPASASPASQILFQNGAPLADHMIQVVQSAPDGPVILTLSPDELGSLSFEVQHSAEGISVHLTVERPETLDLLRRHGDQLLDAFRQAGFAGASFTFSGGEGGQRDRPPSQTAAGWPDPIPPMAQRLVVGLLDIRL